MIPRHFYDLKDLLKNKNEASKKLDIELFVINTSGGINYKKEDFDFEKKLLESKYNKPTTYEIIPGNNKYKINQ